MSLVKGKQLVLIGNKKKGNQDLSYDSNCWSKCLLSKSINDSLISKGCSNNSTQDRETIFIDLVFKNYIKFFYLKYVF